MDIHARLHLLSLCRSPKTTNVESEDLTYPIKKPIHIFRVRTPTVDEGTFGERIHRHGRILNAADSTELHGRKKKQSLGVMHAFVVGHRSQEISSERRVAIARSTPPTGKMTFGEPRIGITETLLTCPFEQGLCEIVS